MVHIIIYCITTYILTYTFTGQNRQTCTNILYQIFITCICGNSGADTLPQRLYPSDYIICLYVLYIVCIDIICNMCKWCAGVVCIIYNIYIGMTCVYCV